jgi:hypothetical protein
MGHGTWDIRAGDRGPTGAKIAEVAWSEMRYSAYCYVMPRFGRD